MRELIKFGLVGVGNTLLTVVTFNILIHFQMNYVAANVIAYFIGMLNSYFWNKNWVFEAKQSHKEAFLKFVIVNVIVLGINNFVLYLGVEKFGFSPTISQLIGTAVGMVFNFVLNRNWTFKKD